MIKSFETRASNIKSRIDSVTPNGYTGLVSVKFSVLDPRISTGQVYSLRYGIGVSVDEMDVAPDEVDATPESFTDVNCTIEASGIQVLTNIKATQKWTQYTIIWDAKRDLDLEAHTDLQVWLTIIDSDGVRDDTQISDTFALDIGVYVELFPEPLSYLTDTTPIFIFEIPYSCLSIYMHFILIISLSSDLSNPIQTINSEDSQVGWEYQTAGVYGAVGSGGVPDISQLTPRQRVKHTLQVALNTGLTYYYGITTIVQ